MTSHIQDRTTLQVEQVRLLLLQGKTFEQIEAETGINRRRLYNLKFHYLRDLPTNFPITQAKRRSLTTEQVIKILNFLDRGYSVGKIAKSFGVNRPVIFDIKLGRTYREITGRCADQLTHSVHGRRERELK